TAGQEDRIDLADQALRAGRIPGEVIGDRRPRETSLPGLRRAGRMEPGQAEAGVPVLRHRIPLPGDGERGIEELDLVRALREIPEEDRGWQTERRTVQCRSCKAVSGFDPARVGQRCEFCG